MERDHVRTTDKAIGPWVWQRGLRAAGMWGFAAACLVLAWMALQFLLLQGRLSLADLAGVVGVAVVLSVLLERCFSTLPFSRLWRCRLAFLTSAVLGTAGAAGSCWLAAPGAAGCSFWWRSAGTLTPGAGPLLAGALWTAGILTSILGGAFLGGLAATGLQQGLWENNSPPSERVRQEVHQLHRLQIGQPRSTSGPKRWFDVLMALLGLILSFPIWFASIFLIWLEDPGPVLFVKNSVGLGGRNFRQFKFRTMVLGAEDGTGPIRSYEGDERILRCGRLLRKTALDELPQLINILIGEMSFVGPRPQRTVLVREYLAHLPKYAERHQVRPGLAGLAQVAGDYYLTPRQKLRFDRLYIRHHSLAFDLKLILLAFLIAFWFRWQKNWNGRIPRRLIHS